MPKHIGFLLEHAPIVGRDGFTSVDIEIGLSGKRCVSGGVDPRLRGGLKQAESFAEYDLLIVGHRLISEHQNHVRIERSADRIHLNGDRSPAL